jgi:hypothetical protein
MKYCNLKSRFGQTLCGLLGLAALSLGAVSDARADFRFAGVGARPKALGSAYVAVADDANAAYWNPAGLTRDSRSTLMLTNSWLYGVSDIENYYMAMDLPQVGAFHFGVSWVRLGITDIYNEDTLNLAVAVNAPFLEGLSVGVSGKMFLLDAPGYEQFNDPNFNGGDQGYSLDLGALYDSGEAWTLGATVYNLHETSLQLISTTSSPDPIYTEWAAGGSYYFRDTLLVTADFRNREGRTTDIVLHGGAEIWFFDALVLRTGLDQGMVTIGAGLQDTHWQADFSLETDKNLGNIYMLSFTVRN